MRSIAGEHTSCLLFEEIFMRQMPEDVRMQLADEDFSNLDQVARRADTFWQSKNNNCGISSIKKCEDEHIAAISKPLPRNQDRVKQSTMCFYHETFGQNARKCRPSCSFDSSKKNDKSMPSINAIKQGSSLFYLWDSLSTRNFLVDTGAGINVIHKDGANRGFVESYFKYVKKIVQEDLGDDLEHLFSYFDPKPIASASIAQVHKATTIDGEDVAVKIQFYFLKRQYPLNIQAITFFFNFLEFMAPQFSLGWIFKLVVDKLKKELDFKLEAENSERCKAQLDGIDNITVPKVLWHLTGDRILTMEYINGVKLDHNSLGETLIKAFATQIFRYGFVHADPHPSNLLVRRKVDGKAELVLLDHGLYEEIGHEHVKNLARLWIAGCTSDLETLKNISDKLNVADYTLLWEILFQRPYLLTISGQLKAFTNLSPDHRKLLIHKFSSDRLEKITQTLQSLPHEYLLILRNINLVRSIVQDLRDPVDRYFLMAK
ncbi:putative aarF domain-containing protein kinase 5 [Thelohanellus kitauei]|uniref:Putative aarF domain-containing protein kinase 5 n=1 Tax=Thelohanellus kitauei TaxID=669202 RepID=A0A0C2ME66_THEKT|nr:putative aarF domain-containing protein kinase 5 [Thelohanellus kitauei]